MAATSAGGDGGPRKMRRLQKDVLALVQACRPQTRLHREQLATCFAAARGAYVTWLARVFSLSAEPDAAQLQLVAWRKWRDLQQCCARGNMNHQETVNALRTAVLRCMRCIQIDSKCTGEPFEDANAVGALLLMWMLHANGSLRLEDEILEIMTVPDDDSEASCMSHAIDVALSRASVGSPSSDDSVQNSFASYKMTTHGVVRAVLECVVALAFSDNEITERETAANRLLRQLCSCSSSAFSIASLRIVMDLLRTREEINASNNESGLTSNRKEKTTAFVRSLVHGFLVTISRDDQRQDQDTRLEIFQAYRLCLAPSTAVQIFRQLVYESQSGAIDTTSCFSGVTFKLISDFSIHSTEFASHSLTLAHQLADDALTQLNASLLLQSLELASAVAASLPEQASIECYEAWFSAHFSTQEYSNGSEGKPAGCSRQCLNATCSLVATKRQLQFICAFLLEFGRRLAGDSRVGTESCLSSADQLGVHLRVMKSHQGKHSMEGLIMDFCGQTRSSIHILRAKEQSTPTITPTLSSVNVPGTSFNSVSYPMKTRMLVQEQVAFLRTQGKLSPEVPQWRLFQPQEWKQSILPYCLDFSAHISLNGPQLADIPLLDQVAFVNELAKRGMVSSKDYAVFLVKAEQCADRIEVNGKKKSYKRHRRAIGGELKETARRFQQNVTPMKNADASLESDPPSPILEKLKICTAKALEAMEIGEDVDDTKFEDALAKSVWEYGFALVLDTLSLDQLDRFFRYQLSVLSSVRKTDNECYGNTLARLIRFGMNQIPWTGGFDLHGLNQLCCVCGVLAAMSDTNLMHPAHSWITVFCQIKENCLKREIDSSSQQLRCLICSVFLRARGFLPGNIELSLPPHDSSPGLQMLVWLAFMSKHHGLHREMHSSTALTSHQDGNDVNQKHWSIQELLLNSQYILSQQQWCHEFVINYSSTLEYKQAKQIMATEFRIGTDIFIDCDRQSLLIDSLAWVQNEAAMIAAISKNYTLTTSEDIGTWIVEAMMNCAQGLNPNQTKISTLRLLLNEMMHRVWKSRARTESSNAFQAQTASMQRESFLDFVLATTNQRLDEVHTSDSLGKYELFGCVMEILALCLHHQLPMTTGTPTLLHRFLDHVAGYVQERMAWDWLRVVFVLSAHGGLLKVEYNISTLTIVRHVANSVLTQFALEYHRLHQELMTTDHNGSLPLDANMSSFFLWLSHLCSELLGATARVDTGIKNGLQSPDDSVLNIFPTVLERVKYKIQVAKSLLESKCLSTSIGGADLTRKQTAYLRILACTVLRDSSSRAQAGHDQRWSGDLACWLCQEWMVMSAGSTSSNLQQHQQEPSKSVLQLLLLHITAELCRQFTGAGRKLLQSWTAESKRNGFSRTAIKAVFTTLVVATIDRTPSQLESVLTMNGSLWVNEFPRMAFVLHASSKSSSVNVNALEGDAANMHLLSSVVCSTSSFQEKLEGLLQSVLQFGVEKRIDVLDASLPSQIIRTWPRLEVIVSRLHILSFTDAASGMLYQ